MVTEDAAKTPFTPPDTPEDCQRGPVFQGTVITRDHDIPRIGVTEYTAPSHNEILDNDWWLVKDVTDGPDRVLTYRTHDGYVIETYDIANNNVNLERQEFLDKHCRRLNVEKDWGVKEWMSDGKIASYDRSVILLDENDRAAFKACLEANDGVLFAYKEFNEQGQLTAGELYRSRGADIYEESWYCYPDGKLRVMSIYSFDDYVHCAHENIPCYVAYDDKHALCKVYYKVKRGDESVFHRTDGPAIIDNTKPRRERERYFIDGIEYANKRDWKRKLSAGS